jgi:hypothetical protein
MPIIRVMILGALVVGLFGCGKKADMAPGARLIQSGEVKLWAVCDRGTKIYLTEKGIAQVIPLGCIDGNP